MGATGAVSDEVEPSELVEASEALSVSDDDCES